MPGLILSRRTGCVEGWICTVMLNSGSKGAAVAYFGQELKAQAPQILQEFFDLFLREGT